MASGSHLVALEDAAGILGVSVTQLEERIEAGELPEATNGDDGAPVIERAELSAIAQREGWVIDLRNGEEPSSEFTEMLERLLGLGQQLIEETSARKVAENSLAHTEAQLDKTERRVRELENTIEELEAENVRLGKDLAETSEKMRVGDAIAKERFETILDLQATIERSSKDHHVELEHHRRTERDLRDRAEKAQAAMGWWSRRRFNR